MAEGMAGSGGSNQPEGRIMSGRKNKFGIASVEETPVGLVPRRRGGGPMSSAVRETAENVAEATEARVEQRKLNAADARLYREAMEQGRVIYRIPVGAILTTDLPRDRMDLDGVAKADEMDELKASIRAHGQKEPIELYRDVAGELQLKKGWRRLTALRALLEETGDEQFGLALARIVTGPGEGGVNGRLLHYVEMVEENTIRQDLTYAEMANLAIEAAADPEVDGDDPEAMVNRLYGSLHKMKRSHLRSFVAVLVAVGDALRFPKALSRDMGLDLARALKERADLAEALRGGLAGCADADSQNATLRAALTEAPTEEKPAPARYRQKFEFHVGESKITARKGEFRIKDQTDFTEVPRERLEVAVAAFHKALRDG